MWKKSEKSLRKFSKTNVTGNLVSYSDHGELLNMYMFHCPHLENPCVRLDEPMSILIENYVNWIYMIYIDLHEAKILIKFLAYLSPFSVYHDI